MSMSMDEQAKLDALQEQVNQLAVAHAALRQRVEEHLDGKDVSAEFESAEPAAGKGRRNAQVQGSDAA